MGLVFFGGLGGWFAVSYLPKLIFGDFSRCCNKFVHWLDNFFLIE